MINMSRLMGYILEDSNITPEDEERVKESASMFLTQARMNLEKIVMGSEPFYATALDRFSGENPDITLSFSDLVMIDKSRAANITLNKNRTLEQITRGNKEQQDAEYRFLVEKYLRK